MRTPLLFNQPCFRLLSFLVSFFLSSPDGRAQSTTTSIFVDHFTGNALGKLWQQPTSWTVANGSAYIFVDGGERWLRTNSAYTATSYIIETAARGFTINYRRAFRIAFGQQNPADQKMYILNYHPDFGGLVTLGVSTDNFYYPKELDKAVLYPNVTAEKVYKFRIAKYESGLIQVYVDRGSGFGNVPFLEAIDNTYKNLGHVSWREDTETYPEEFFVDWIRAVKPAAEKPAVTEKPLEDDLITQVSAESGRTQKVTKLTAGINAYTDRAYTITSFPSYLTGASFLQTAMDDKWNRSATFLTSFLTKQAIVYVGYDPRAGTLPDWLKDWTKTGDRIEMTDPGTPYVELYSKLVDYWQIFPRPLVLGGNLASPAAGAEMNYVVAAIPVPASQKLEAETAGIFGAKLASNHSGYSGSGFVDYLNPSGDYIEWSFPIAVPGTYNLGFVYSNGSKADRPLQIAKDGSPLTTLQFPPSFSWNSWAFTSGPNVFLKAGTYRIRATATGSSGPNMDFLSLSYLSASPSTNYVSRVLARPVAGTGLTAAPGLAANAYPNPFVSSAVVSYTVNETGRVNLSVFSAGGQLVQVLVNEVKETGKYTVILDGRKLAPGTYFYRIQQGNNIRVGKLSKQ
jgi:hypothetical protein